MEELKSKFEGIRIFDSGKPGKTVAIMGGMHGNEPCGVSAIRWLQKEFLPTHPMKAGRLVLILGNPHAIRDGRRYIATDLNRLFGGKNARRGKSAGVEGARIRELKEALEPCEALLDIHSTSNPSKPMTCSMGGSETLRLCKKLPVRFITIGWEGKVNGMSSDEFMDSRGKMGVTLECGSHRDKTAERVAFRACKVFLMHFGLVSGKSGINRAPILEIYKTVFPQSTDFHFTVPAKGFAFISKGNSYAMDGAREYVARRDSYLVMPAKKTKLGEEACYLAFQRRGE